MIKKCMTWYCKDNGHASHSADLDKTQAGSKRADNVMEYVQVRTCIISGKPVTFAELQYFTYNFLE